MGQELYWIYAFNVIINSTLSFFTTIVFIELFVCLLRVKHPRVKMICRFLPFCKICIDLFLSHFSNWALLHGVNPILAETGTRQLSIMVNPFIGIQFSMQDGKTFSLADVIALSIDPLWTRMIVFTAIVGTVFASIVYLICIVRGKRRVDLIVQGSTPIHQLTLNPSLTSWLKRKQIRCAVTSAVDAPCIAGKTILFPAQLINDLSQEECEAIVAHEIAHLQWRDCGLRLAYSIVAAVFWWIPTGWGQRRIEEMQEQASDSMIHRFGISRFALAEAVLKTAQKSRVTPSKLVFSFVERRLPLKSRMQMILQEPIPRALGWKTIQYGLLGISLLSILLGKLLIF
ncbi:MAG: M56 family metallopeptidase [Rhabdochlamydiaceae bacterium]|jgi:beta-lactamase regulating signal transducer with metallopeptidase domain